MRRPEGSRDPVAGPDDGPEAPFPIKLSGPVIRGFGRGSKELGIPTANIPPSGLSAYPDISTGVYYGYVGLSVPSSSLSSSRPSTATTPSSTSASSSPPSTTVSSSQPLEATTHILPSVLSIGYNPFYSNKTRSIEIHILRPFTKDFYGAPLNLLILGFIRPEYDYDSLENLIEDIRTDCAVATRSLDRPAYRKFVAADGDGDGSLLLPWLEDFSWVERDADGRIRYAEGDGSVKGAEVKE